MSAGARFRAALEAESPLQIAGTINAYSALLAERAGFRAIYLSGAGVANASFRLPELALRGWRVEGVPVRLFGAVGNRL